MQLSLEFWIRSPAASSVFPMDLVKAKKNKTVMHEIFGNVEVSQGAKV